MRDVNINHAFLDGVLAGDWVDVYYHLGLTSRDPMIAQLHDVRTVVLAGSGPRVVELARRWSELRAGAPLLALPKEERFVTRLCDGVLFVSHGMGMASASIALQELMRLMFLVTRGDLEALDEVLWVRIGTSGGVGIPPGSVVVTTEAVMADLRPFRVLDGAQGERPFDGTFPRDVVDEIVAANGGTGGGLTTGRTVSGNDFFLEQFRLDGAVRLHTAEQKDAWLRWIHSHGVRNIEMEGAMLAGYLNHWGFPRFAMICCTLLDRLQSDQVAASADELRAYNERAGTALFAHLLSSGSPAVGLVDR